MHIKAKGDDVQMIERKKIRRISRRSHPSVLENLCRKEEVKLSTLECHVPCRFSTNVFSKKTSLESNVRSLLLQSTKENVCKTKRDRQIDRQDMENTLTHRERVTQTHRDNSHEGSIRSSTTLTDRKRARDLKRKREKGSKR